MPSSLRRSRVTTTTRIIKKYKCDLYLYSSDRLSNFKRHLLIYTNEKPTEFSISCKNFSQKTNLKTLIRIHTKETPYQSSVVRILISHRA